VLNLQVHVVEHSPKIGLIKNYEETTMLYL
jgi:hypothetical protein